MMSTAYLLGARTLCVSVFLGVTAGAAASALSAQMPLRDGNAVNKEPYLFSAEDFGIDPGEVTFTKDIAPILQRSCQDCHHPGGGSPMSLITYEEVRQWGPMIKHRTAIRDRMGAMPPWFIEKNWLSWIVYRGPSAHVSFDPVQMKTWMDTRLYANSPWSPPFVIPEPPADDRWVTQVTFEEPGEYVLRAVASDGSLFTYENVMVTATR